MIRYASAGHEKLLIAEMPVLLLYERCQRCMVNPQQCLLRVQNGSQKACALKTIPLPRLVPRLMLLTVLQEKITTMKCTR